jgi:hypothetical protein
MKAYRLTGSPSGALPVFQPTASPELDTLLTTIRSKYFLPQYLNDAQRKLIRSNKLRSQLENDPIYATLGDEEIRLEHIDVTREMPPRSSFLEVIRLLGTEKKDWQNLPGLLEGYHRSKVRLDNKWLAVAIEKAREAGALSVVMQCLQQVESNGFSLGIPEVREGVLLGLRREAKEAGWDVEGTKSLKRVEAVLRHMEHKAHCGSRRVTETDPRAEPFVIAVPLELAAQEVLKNGNVELMSKVEIYSTRLITAIAQQKSEWVCSHSPFTSNHWIPKLTCILVQNDAASWQMPTSLTKPFEIRQAQRTLERTVAKFIPVYNALKLAQQVRGESWPEEERAFAAHLQNQIEQKLNLAVAESDKVAQSTRAPMPGIEEWKAAGRS